MRPIDPKPDRRAVVRPTALTGRHRQVVLTSALGLAFAVTALPSAIAAQQTCRHVNRVCGSWQGDECMRYENVFKCWTANSAADQCTPSGNPTLSACDKTDERCTATQENTCLETETALLCRARPSGPGVTVGKPRLSITYETAVSGSVPDGCRITSERCLDAAPRQVPVENLPGETVTASPACWVNVKTVSCPASADAKACQTLEAAGCVRVGDPVCESHADGLCVRWSSTYLCKGQEVTGPDISTDGETSRPGDLVEDTSDCDKRLENAGAESLDCTLSSKVCVKPDPTGARPCLVYESTYDCRRPATDTCQKLEALTAAGRCRPTAPDACDETGPDGTCLAATQRFVCAEDVGPADAAPADYLGNDTVTNHKPSDVCSPVGASPGDALRFASTEAAPRGGAIPSLSAFALPALDGLRTARVPTSDGIPQGCVRTDRVCSEGSGIRFVHGRPEYRDCWAWTETYLCQAPGRDECAALDADKACRLVNESCPDGDTPCLRPTRHYRCQRPGTSGVIGEVCDGQICVEGVCRPADGKPDDGFVDAILQLEIGRQLGAYADVANGRFFNGQVSSCKDRKGAESCCRADVVPTTSNTAFGQFLVFGVGAGTELIKWAGSPYVYDLLSWSDHTSGLLTRLYGTTGTGAYSPSFSFWGATATYANGQWAFGFSPAGFALAAATQFWDRYQSCDTTDQRTAMAKSQRLCHYVGTTCEKRVAGLGCVKTAEKHVCFNSRLARIIHEQGRPQLGRTFGTAVAPDARGFTIDEMSRLDFAAMDLSEFVNDIVREVAGKGGITAQQAAARAKERIAAMVKGEIGITSDVPGADHTTAAPDQPTDPKGNGGPATPSAKPLGRSLPTASGDRS